MADSRFSPRRVGRGHSVSRALAALAVATILLANPRPGESCLHPGMITEAVTEVAQLAQQALIIHSGGIEHLILAVDFQTAEAAPSLGWVIPVPSLPSEYAMESRTLFDELSGWVNLTRAQSMARGASVGDGMLDGDESGPEPALVLLEPAQVGPFTIQPMQAHGTEAAAALNEWMVENSFHPLPSEEVDYYVERNWTFLAVRIDPNEGAAVLDAEGALPPLRVSFATETIVYPLKLSAHQGVFPIRLYLVTERRFTAAEFLGVQNQGFEIAQSPNDPYLRGRGAPVGSLWVDVGRFTPSEAPASLSALLTPLTGWADDMELRLRVLYVHEFNRDHAMPETWAEDIAIPTLPEGTQLMGQ